MHIPFVCPSCSHKMKVPVSFAGKKVKCLQCTALALVPVPEPAATAAVPVADTSSPEGIVFTCPSCGACFEVAADLAGKSIRCRECNEWARVPAAAGEDEAPDEELVAVDLTPAAAPEGSGSHTPLAAEGEQVFYRRHGVLVTDTRLAVGGSTYSLADVSAAQKAWREHLEYRFRPVFAALCVLSVAALAALLVGALSASGRHGSVGPWLVGMLLAVPAVVGCGILGGGRVRRRTHHLVLVRSGVEVKVLESDNAVLVSDVFDAVNQAVAARK
jgi:hypothetical protein